jgi:hypothetical protein
MTHTRLVSVLLPLSLLLPCAAAAAGFPDVEPTHPYIDAALYVQQQGFIQGYVDGTFRPEKTINRAEFTKIVAAVFLPGADCGGAGGFSDVRGDEWFASAICAARAKQFIGGYPDGTFRPEKEINFVEAAKIVALAAGLKTSGYGTAFQTWGSEEVKQFWYKPYVDALSAEKAIPPTIGTFTEALTRGEMADMIYRLRTHPLTAKKTADFNGLWGTTYYERYDEPPPVFDGCGPVTAYAKKTWYGKLENQAQHAGFALSSVSEACLAPHAEGMVDDVLILIVPGAADESSRVYQFAKNYVGASQPGMQTKPEEYAWQLRGATRVDGSMDLYKAKTFGKRNRELIPVEGEKSDGACAVVVRSAYDIERNTIRLTASERRCVAANVCTAPGTPREIGDTVYPVAPAYAQLPWLGQIFTASDCGAGRLQAVAGGGNGSYVLGSTVTLKAPASPELEAVLTSIGFSCDAAKGCLQWELLQTVQVKALLKLKPYARFFTGDDCRNCG